MFDFVCLGDATRDLFLFLKELPVLDGSKYPVDDLGWSLGGNAANVSVGLSRLGLKAALVTVFGDDDRGVWIKRELLKNNVDLESCLTEASRVSNLSTIIVVNSERTILSYHSTGNQQIGKIPDCQWLYLTSAPDRDPKDLFDETINLKKEKPGLKIAFNPNIIDLNKGSAFLSPVLAVVDILILNREEAVVFLGVAKETGLEELARDLGKLGPKMVVITDGQNGAVIFDGQNFIQKPAIKAQALETTGAGDAFSSGFLAAIFYGKKPDEALDWGLRNSSSVVQKIGAIEGLLTKNVIASEAKQ